MLLLKYLTSRAMCINAGKLRLDESEDSVIQSTIAKYYSSKIAMEVTTGCGADFWRKWLYK